MDDDTNKSLRLKRNIKLPLLGVVAAEDSLTDVLNSLLRKTPNVKVMLLAKLREYRSDLNLNQADRAKLLESGMADASTICFAKRTEGKTVQAMLVDVVKSVFVHTRYRAEEGQ
ncbi:hypothetical protein Tco_0595464 [Tanacetum coccineum]